MSQVQAIVKVALVYRGADYVRANAAKLADDSLCSKAYILSLLRKYISSGKY